MTASSPRGRRIQHAATLLEADAPADAAFVRDVVAGNPLHFADCASRYFVNWIAPASGVWTGGAVARYIQPTSMASGWNTIFRAGPFNLTVRDDGTPYAIRVKVRGARSGGAGDVTFAVGVGTWVADGDPPVLVDVRDSPAGDNSIIYDPFTSTTPAWGVPDIGTSPIVLVRAQVDGSVRRRPTLDDTGGDPTEVDLVEVGVYVFAMTTDTTNSIARLHGLEVAEYVG